MTKGHCLILCILWSISSASFAQQSEAFYGFWDTSMGGYINAVVRNPADASSFYVAFDVRKFQGTEDYNTLVTKYDCRGTFRWNITVETEADNDRLVDMAILPSGQIGLLQQNATGQMTLHIIQSNGTVSASYQFEPERQSDAWQVAASPEGNSFLLVFGYDIPGDDVIGIVELRPNGTVVRSLISQDTYDDRGIVEWGELNELTLKTGKEIRRVDLSTGAVDAHFVEDMLMQDGAILSYEDTYYVAYIEEGSGPLHILRFVDETLSWHQMYEAERNFQYVRMAKGVDGPILMLEEGFNGGNVIFASLDLNGNVQESYITTDELFEPILGDFDIDQNGNWLYSGSSIAQNGSDDFTARLNPSNPCIASYDISVRPVGSGLISVLNVPDMQTASWEISEIPGIVGNSIPPEDRMCLDRLDNIATNFPDTNILCDSVYVLTQNLPPGYLLNGEPYFSPIRLTVEGMYQLSWRVCEQEFTHEFMLSFQDCECQWYIPNVFTPNGDGINDTFNPEGNCFHSDYQLQVFDRWGNLLFDSNSAFIPWDGTYRDKECGPGVYTYRLSYITLADGQIQQQTGTVTLVR